MEEQAGWGITQGASTIQYCDLVSAQALSKELAYLARRQGETAIYEERKHDKALGRMYKEVQRHNRKR